MPDTPDKLLQIFDEAYKPEVSNACSLVMEIEKRQISWSLLDAETNLFLGIGTFHGTFEDFADSQKWVENVFRETRIVISSSASTLIPSALFLEKELETYLDFNIEREKDETVRYGRLENLGIYTVYSLPGKLLNEIQTVFADATISHVSGILLESIYLNYKNLMNAGKIFLNVRDEAFDMAIFNGRQLSFFNSFPLRTQEDLVYFVIFVMEQQNLNPEEIPVVLMGDIEHQPGLFDLLFKYVRNVDFAARNGNFRYSAVLNDIPSHRYYTLFNCLQCGS